MTSPTQKTASPLRPLIWAWLALVALTLISLGLGRGPHGVAWLQLVVAAIVWLKGMLVARQFIEIQLAHPFIRRVLLAFIAVAPLALVLTAFLSGELTGWTTL